MNKHTQYVALLRGINFGGNNTIEMSKLKDMFISSGFKNVHTYINSGNIVFSSGSSDTKKIAQKIEKEILNYFQLDIKVLVQNAENISNILEKAERLWKSEAGMRVHVVFLFEEIDSPAIIQQIGADPTIDRVTYVPGALIWNVDLKNWSKGSVYKFTNSARGKHTTVRSIKTVKKINELLMLY
jgi:uncharacterized protein (DUF1697 family)